VRNPGKIPKLKLSELENIPSKTPYIFLAKFLLACETANLDSFKKYYTSDSQDRINNLLSDPNVLEVFVASMRKQIGFEVILTIQKEKNDENPSDLWLFIKTHRSSGPTTVSPIEVKMDKGEYKMFSTKSSDEIIVKLNTFFANHEVDDLVIEKLP
jgi:hypothetical protein